MLRTTLSCRRTNDSFGSAMPCLCARLDSGKVGLLVDPFLDLCHAALETDDISISLSVGFERVPCEGGDGSEATNMSYAEGAKSMSEASIWQGLFKEMKRSNKTTGTHLEGLLTLLADGS